MRKILIAVMAIVMVCGLWVTANAGLSNNLDGTITDDDFGIMWLQDAGMGGLRNWADAMTWAENLVFAGHDDWRLPTALNEDGSGPCLGFNCTRSEMGHLYYTELGNVAGGGNNSGPFINLQPVYWSGTEIAANPDAAYLFLFNFGQQDAGFAGNNPKDYIANAWAVRPVGAASVPEPATMLLLGSGLLGLWGARKKFKK